MESDFSDRMGGGLNANFQEDADLERLFLIQLRAIGHLDNECGTGSEQCGNCYAAHQMERFDVAIGAIKKLRVQFQKRYRGLL